jgi:methylglutaconyl-CoA hydratase
MPNDNPTVLFEVDGPVAQIKLNRPDKRNALNDELIADLKSALRRTDRDESIRCVVIRGVGSDFCSGADLSALQKISKASVGENLEDARLLMELFVLIRKLHVPVIAAVHGRALAGGCGLALACDIVLAEQSARFGFPEVKIGFVPAMVMAILRRSASEKIAFELITGGEEIPANKAEQFGLVNRVFATDKFEEELKAFVGRFEKLSRSAVALTKRLFYRTDAMDFEDALFAGVDVNTTARMTDDCKTGVSRFLERSKA